MKVISSPSILISEEEDKKALLTSAPKPYVQIFVDLQRAFSLALT